MKITEHAVQLGIMQYLSLRYPEHYLWRNNSGRLPSSKGRMVAFGKVGSADIIGIAPDGRFVAIEIKRPDRSYKPTPAQLEFLEAIKSRGGYAGIVTCPEDVDAILRG